MFVLWKPESNLQCTSSEVTHLGFWDGVFYWPEVQWLDYQDWPAGPRDTLFSASLQMCLTPHGLFLWVVGPKLRSLCLHGKHLTNYTISQATPHFYLFKCLLLCKIYFYYCNSSLFLRITFMYTMKYDHIHGTFHPSTRPSCLPNISPSNFMFFGVFYYY